MITQDLLNKLFNYNPDTGQLTRKVSVNNKTREGDLVGWIDKSGYRKTIINSKSYLVHRAVFLMLHGYLPCYIDHVNGIRDDNRATNLRECTAEENAWNRLCKREPEKVGNKWRSRIDFKKKRINFGSFDSYELAKIAMMEGVKCLHEGFFRNE